MAKTIGEWEIVRDMPESGQAWVYVVKPRGATSDSDLYVLKRLKKKQDPARVERFGREVEAALKLSHPNIIRIVDDHHEDPEPFFVSEYYRGGALEDANLATFSLIEKLRLFEGICRGVGYAHSNGVIHRDLKPANILLREDGRAPVVSDFGLCLMMEADDRLTATTEAVGSRWYMAPELAHGRYEDVRPVCDVYSLGKILYWLISGGRIFDREEQRDPSFDLTRSDEGRTAPIWFIYDLLDGTVVKETSGRRYKDANALASLVSATIDLLEMHANPIGLDRPQRCRYCGMGTYHRRLYRPLENNVDRQNDASSTVGVQILGGSSSPNLWLFLVCDHCGNLQIFRPDLALDRDLWGKDVDSSIAGTSAAPREPGTGTTDGSHFELTAGAKAILVAIATAPAPNLVNFVYIFVATRLQVVEIQYNLERLIGAGLVQDQGRGYYVLSSNGRNFVIENHLLA